MDYFSLLGVAKQPWLDLDELKGKFHSLSSRHHPDVHRTGSASNFEQLNTAYQTLRDPVRRLRYLLELEAPQMLGRSGEVPSALIPFFLEASQTRAMLDQFLARHGQATTALAQALLASEKALLIGQMRGLVERINQLRDETISKIQKLENHTPKDVFDAYSPLAFLSKWSADLSDALRRLEAL